MCLALLDGQNRYLGKAPFAPDRVPLVLVILGAIAAVFVSGSIGQALYFVFLAIGVAKLGFLVGWVLLGGLLGRGVSFFIPNLDGKTIGSVIEMLLVAVLETFTFSGLGVPPLKLNPARGIDLPDLDLGVKSPSENFCTGEPFFSPYERLLGSEHDVLHGRLRRHPFRRLVRRDRSRRNYVRQDDCSLGHVWRETPMRATRHGTIRLRRRSRGKIHVKSARAA